MEWRIAYVKRDTTLEESHAREGVRWMQHLIQEEHQMNGSSHGDGSVRWTEHLQELVGGDVGTSHACRFNMRCVGELHPEERRMVGET